MARRIAINLITMLWIALVTASADAAIDPRLAATRSGARENPVFGCALFDPSMIHSEVDER